MKRSTINRTGKLSSFPAALFNRRAAAMLATGALLLAGNSASAGTFWIAGGTSPTATSGGATDVWENPANWSNGLPDTGPQNAFINNGGTVLIGSGTTNTYSSNDLNTGGSDATGVTVPNGSGTYTMTGATTTLTIHGWMRLGISAGSTGVFNMNAGTTTVTGGNVHIGEGNGTNFANAAQLNITGGTFANGGGHISIGGGNGAAGTGMFTFSGASTLLTSAGEFWVGDGVGSTGVMNMTGGTINLSNFLAVGRQSGTGTVNQSGGTITKTGNGNIEIGTFDNGANVGIGFYNLSGTGVVNDNSGADLIGTGGGTGTLTISGGTFNMAGGYTSVGANGTGTLNITAGSYIDSGGQDFNVGDNGGTHGTLNVSGTGVLNTATGNFYVGKNGTGVVNLGTGVAGGQITTKNIIGSAGGTFNFNGGTLQADAASATFMHGLAAANVQAGGAHIDTNGQVITISQPLLGSVGDGGLTLADSTAAPGGTLILTGANTYNGATTLTNGTLQLGDGTTDGTIANTSGVTDNSALSYDLLINRTPGYVISGTGSVTLNDTGGTLGTLTFNKAQTYTGATNVTSGSLTLDHSGANTGSLGNTAVTVSSANTLFVKGSTTIGSPGTGSLNSGGGAITSLQDGNINTLGIGGPLTLNSATLNLDLGSASGVSDKINVGGAASIAGATINLDALGSIASGASTYTLLTAASGLGPTAFMLGTTPAGFNTYNLTSSTPTAEILSITANPTVVGAEYFTGAASRANGDTANNFGFGSSLAVPKSNFSTDRAGTMDPKQVPGATTDLIFTANNATPSTGTPGILTTQLDGAYTIHSLTFDVPAVTTITSTVIDTNGNTLTIGAGGLVVAPTSNSSGTINGTGGVILNGSQSFADNSALALTVSPATITGNAASGTNTLTFAGTGSGPVTVGGAISDGLLGGNEALAVSKTGGGVLTLSGANTYTGGTTLNSGQVILGSPIALGSGPLTFGAGSTSDLQLAGNSITVNGISSNATVGTPIIENASATPATLTDNAGTAVTYGGVLQDGAGGGALSLTETGGGVQTLTGANTYTGGTTVNAPGGGLALGAGGTLGASTNTLTATAGTVDLGGQSVTQNELILNGGNVVGPTSTLTLTATGSTAVLISGTGYTFAAPADTANLALNGGNIVKTATVSGGNPNIAGNITLGSGGSTIALQDTPGDNFPELTLSGVISGPGALTQDNSLGGTSTQEYGSLLLSGANTYTGGTNINFGRTEIANSTALGTGPVTVGSNGTLALGGGAFQNVIGGNLTVANNLTLNHTVTGNYGIDAIQSNFGANTLTGTISLQAPLNAFTINGGSVNATGVISGTGALSKYGGALLTLSAPNTYSGGTNIYGGTLSVGDIENGGVVSSIGTSSNAPANLVFGGGTLQYTGPTVTTDRGYTVTGGNGGLNTGANNVTFTGQILATGGSFTKTGAGTVTYTNTASPNTFDGSTGNPGFQVNQGSAVFGTPAATASGMVNNIGGELDLGGTGQVGNVSMDINSGTTNIGTYLGIGRGNSTTGATSILNVNTDAAVNSTDGSLGYANGLVGYNSAPTLNLNATSAYTDTGVLIVGESAGSTATVNINNSATLSLPGTNPTPPGQGNILDIGLNGVGVVNQNGGTVTAAMPIAFGMGATGNGTYNLNAGTLNTAGFTKGPGTGTINFNGGTLQATAANTALLGGITANVLGGGAIINTNGNADTIAAPLIGSVGDGGLTKAGAGTLTLTGANTYNGATTITGGNLTVGSGGATPTGSIASTSAVNVDGGTTLTVANNGALNNIATAVTLGSGGTGGTLQNGLNGTATLDGSGNSITNNVQRAGTLSLGTGTSDILDFANNTGTFDFAGAGASFSSGQKLTVENFGVGANEMLNGAPAGTEVGNYQLLFDTGLTTTQLGDISFLNSDSTQFGAVQQKLTSGANSGKFQVLESAVAAPEPAQTAALGLFGLGLGALILKARKRKAAGTIH